MDIYFTRHAREKFKVLAEHGVRISEAKVVDTVKMPDVKDSSRYPLTIAQSDLDKNHVLRVVYKVDAGVIVIITFYPGRKLQYEK
jgi:mRNA-degrading endonuclease RelE of RelBE toxin-antitoxin system